MTSSARTGPSTTTRPSVRWRSSSATVRIANGSSRRSFTAFSTAGRVASTAARRLTALCWRSRSGNGLSSTVAATHSVTRLVSSIASSRRVAEAARKPATPHLSAP